MVKREMGRWEERNNEDNEEKLEFGTGEGGRLIFWRAEWGRTRMLGKE